MATGRIPLIGLTGNQVATYSGQAVAQSLPNSFAPYLGGNQLIGGIAQGAINVSLSSVLGNQVAGQTGFDLDAGNTFLQSQITPLLTNGLATQVNTALARQLQSAGPAGPIIANLAGQVVAGLGQSVATGLLGAFGGAGGGTGASRRWPGGGGQGEEPADYNGSTFNLGNGGPDVVFSIQPANSGPQSAGVNGAQNTPTTAVNQTSNQVTSAAKLNQPSVLSPREIAASRATPSNSNPISSAGITAVSTRAASTGVLSPRERAAALSSPAAAASGVSASQFSVQNLPGFEKAAQELGSQPLQTGANTVALAGIASSLAQRASLGPVGLGNLAGAQVNTGAWTFIVAPEDISWSTGADVQRIPIFGSNQNPVIVGSKGMRDLTLGNALVEGFTRNISVEGKIALLEDMLNYSLNSSQGFVNVPLYRVSANSKYYGTGRDNYDQGIFAIKEVSVKEVLRDLKGNTTRATVDISLTQVPPYQVDTGRDQATTTAPDAAKASALFSNAEKATQLNSQLNQGASTAASRSGVTGPTAAAAPASKPGTGGAPRVDPRASIRAQEPGSAYLR